MEYSIEKMAAIVEKKVKHYKTDFYDYDIKTIEDMQDNTRFLWLIRETGTYIARLDVENKKTLDRVFFRNCAIDLVNFTKHYNSAAYYEVCKNKYIKKITEEKASEIAYNL